MVGVPGPSTYHVLCTPTICQKKLESLASEEAETHESIGKTYKAVMSKATELFRSARCADFRFIGVSLAIASPFHVFELATYHPATCQELEELKVEHSIAEKEYNDQDAQLSLHISANCRGRSEPVICSSPCRDKFS